MVRVDVITTTGALLTFLGIKVRFASAINPAKHMRALATSTSDGDTPQCHAELDVCYADAECLSCARTLVDKLDALDGVCEGPDFDEDTATCSEMLEVGCCEVEEIDDCLVTNDAMVAFIDCVVADDGCLEYSITDCIDGGGSPTHVGRDDATPATSSDNGSATADSKTTTNVGDGGDSSRRSGLDDGDDSAVGIAAAVDEEQEDADGASDTEADSATPSAGVGGTVAMFVAFVVSLAFVTA